MINYFFLKFLICLKLNLNTHTNKNIFINIYKKPNKLFFYFLIKNYFFLKYSYEFFYYYKSIYKYSLKCYNPTKFKLKNTKKTLNLLNIKNFCTHTKHLNKFNMYIFDNSYFVSFYKFKFKLITPLVISKNLSNKNYFNLNFKFIYTIKSKYFDSVFFIFEKLQKNNKINNYLFKFNQINKIKHFNLNFFIKYILYNIDVKTNFYKNDELNLIFLSNKFIINNCNLLYILNYKKNNQFFINEIYNKNIKLTNYYPVIFSNNKIYSIFFNKFKYSHNLNYLLFNNKLILSFIELFSKKKVLITVSNNYYNKIDNTILNRLLKEYKNFQPIFFKNYSISDFIEILWYSFFLKDLSIISDWISKFMEGLNFKNHKRFVSFFQNFMNKNAGVFINFLGVRGFFFDIRGKVGVTGSSKKRHFFVKFGSLNKSSKNNKIDFNRNLVRSYSGVMGVTYIICY